MLISIASLDEAFFAYATSRFRVDVSIRQLHAFEFHFIIDSFLHFAVSLIAISITD